MAGIKSVLGARLYIGSRVTYKSRSPHLNFVGQSWIEIGEITTLGDLGVTQEMQSETVINDGITRYKKSVIGFDMMENVVSPVPGSGDDGHVRFRQAQASCHPFAFKLENGADCADEANRDHQHCTSRRCILGVTRPRRWHPCHATADIADRPCRWNSIFHRGVTRACRWHLFAFGNAWRRGYHDDWLPNWDTPQLNQLEKPSCFSASLQKARKHTETHRQLAGSRSPLSRLKSLNLKPALS